MSIGDVNTVGNILA